MSAPHFEQQAYPFRLEWGRRGARAAAARGDIVVIVDTLRFTTTAVTAVHQGASVRPFRCTEEVLAETGRSGAISEPPEGPHGLSPLSPVSHNTIQAGARIALRSPNGATCCREAAEATHVFAAGFVNVNATADAIARLRADGSRAVTVVPCGERWEHSIDDEGIRFAIEDYLAAGALLASLCPSDRSSELSPEAHLAVVAVDGVRSDLTRVLLECGSGRELVTRGAREDVIHAAQWNSHPTAVTLRDGWLEPFA